MFAESRLAELHFAETHIAESLFAESYFAEFHFAEFHFAESHIAESRIAESPIDFLVFMQHLRFVPPCVNRELYRISCKRSLKIGKTDFMCLRI